MIAILLLPSASAFILDALRKPAEVLLRQHLAATAGVASQHAAQAALTLAFLPYEAAVNLDAIARTGWRMLVTRRRLLEWNPSAADAADHRRVDDASGRSELATSIRSMWIAPVFATAHRDPVDGIRSVRIDGGRTDSLPVVGSRQRFRLVGQPAAGPPRGATHVRANGLPARAVAPDLGILRDVRRTRGPLAASRQRAGAFADPDGGASHVAHQHGPCRFSPTCPPTISATSRPEPSRAYARPTRCKTMQTLERHQSHFYNWYDTLSLAPLTPLYVSAVDSGNLAGHLLDLAAGTCCSLTHDRIFERAPVRRAGLHRADSSVPLAAAPAPLFDCRGISTPRTIRGPRRSPWRGSGSSGSTRASPR